MPLLFKIWARRLCRIKMRTVEHFYERAKAKRLHPERALKKRLLKLPLLFKIWARRDSNPRPRDYESPALPLRHRPVTTYCFIRFSIFQAQRYIDIRLTRLRLDSPAPFQNLPFRQLLQRSPTGP